MMTSKRGFTLIEVTVALAIFAVASVVISQSFLSGMLSLSLFNFNDTKEELTQAFYQEILSMESRDAVEDGGIKEMLNYGTIKWSADVVETDLPSLFQVDIALQFVDERLEVGSKTAFEGESFYIYRPKWAKVEVALSS